MSAEQSHRAGDKDPEVKKFLQLLGRLLLVMMLFFNIGNDSLGVSPRYSKKYGRANLSRSTDPDFNIKRG